MNQAKINYLLILFMITMTQVVSAPNDDLIKLIYANNGKADTFVINKGFVHFQLIGNELYNHFKIQITPNSIYNNNHLTLYISESNPKPVYHNSIIRAENRGTNTVLLSLNDFKVNRQIYFSVYGSMIVNEDEVEKDEYETFDIILQPLEELSIEEEDEEMIILSKNLNVYTFFPKEPIFNLLIYTVDVTSEAFSMDIKITGANSDDINKKSTKLFRNGQGFYLDAAEIAKKRIDITLKSEINESIRLGIKKSTEEPKHILPHGENFGYLGTKNEIDCYSLENYFLILNVVTYNYPVTVILQNGEREELNRFPMNIIDSLKMYDNDFLTKYICFESTIDNSNPVSDFTSYSFQIMDYFEMEIYQKFLSPTLNGIQTKYIIPFGQAIGFRKKKVNSDHNAINYMHLNILEGNLTLYSHECKEYPCEYSIEKIKEYENNNQIKKANLINKNFFAFQANSNKSNDSSPDTNIAVVTCEAKDEEDCIFDLTMYYDTEIIEILPGAIFYQPITTQNENTFRYRLNDDVGKNSISFVLYSYTGDAIPKVKNKANENAKGIETFYGNKKITTFSSEGSSNIIGDYEISIKGNEYTYYSFSVVYDLEKTIQLNTGEIVLQSITKQENRKVYQIKNGNIEGKSPFVVSVNSLNCNLNVTFGSNFLENEANGQLIAYYGDDGYDKEIYDITVDFLSYLSDFESNDVLCMFYLSGIEAEAEKKLILNENVNHKMWFISGKINKYNYLYPLSYDIKGDTIIVDISFNNENPALKVNCIFEGNKGQKEVSNILTKETRLLFESIIAESCDFNSLCSLNIVIEPNESLTSGSTMDVNIIVKALKKVPTYLTKDQYRKEIIVPNSLQYYYTDIGLNENGEISLTFNKGNGVIYSRIVPKDLREENANWNNHLILPNKDLDPSKMLQYNYSNKKIKYSNTDTKVCQKGCELYVGVQSDSSLLEFSIIKRNTSLDLPSSPIQLNVNEYHYGSISELKTSDIYKFTSPFDTEEINIYLFSDVGKVNIKTNDQVVNEWNISDPKGILTISKKDLGTNTLKEIEFTITVQVNQIILPSSNYRIKVSALNKGEPSLTYFTDEQNEICLFKEPLSNCNLIRLVDKYEKVEYYNMMIESLDNIFNSYVIYVNVFNASDIEGDIRPDNIPTKDKNTLSSVGNIKENILDIDIKKLALPGDFYIIISIQATGKGKGLFVSSASIDTDKMTLNQNSKKMIYTKKGTSCSFSLNGVNNYLVSYNLQSGKGRLLIKGQSAIPLENSIIAEISSKDKEFQIEASSEDLYYDISYIETETKQLKEISFGNENAMILSEPSLTSNYYMKFPQGTQETRATQGNEPISINVKFANYQINSKKGTEEFNFNGYITDRDFIFNSINDPTKLPSGKKIIGTYDQITRTGRILVDPSASREIKDSYLYIELETHETNKNTYSKLQPHITSYPLNSANSNYVLPQKKYYYNSIEPGMDTNIFKLSKSSKTDNKMVIEYASCSGEEIDISLKDSNNNAISVNKISKLGKYFIEVKMEDEKNTINLTVSKKTNNANADSLFYYIKYQTGKDISSDHIYSIEQKLEIDYDIEKKTITTNIKPVLGASNNVVKADYIYRILKMESKDEEILDSICIVNNNRESVLRRLTVDEVSKDISHTINDYHLEKDKYYHVSAIAVLGDEEEIMLVYEGKKFKVIEPMSSWAIALIAIACIVGVGIIAIVSYCCYKKKKERELYSTHQIIVNEPVTTM